MRAGCFDKLSLALQKTADVKSERRRGAAVPSASEGLRQTPRDTSNVVIKTRAKKKTRACFVLEALRSAPRLAIEHWCI